MFKLSVADVDLDMLGAVKQAIVQTPDALVLLLGQLEVNVGLPHDLRHIQEGLFYGQFEDGADTCHLAQGVFKARELHPGRAIGGEELQLLLVQRAAPVDVTELALQVQVRSEDLFPRAEPDGAAKDPAGRLQVPLAHLELGGQHPQEAKGKLLVGHNLEAGPIHSASLVDIPRRQLLVHGVVDPQVYVPLPVPFLGDGRDLGDGALVHLLNRSSLTRRLLQPRIVEPDVVVVRALLELRLVLQATLVANCLLNTLLVAVLLLKRNVACVQFLGGVPRDVVQGVTIDGAGALEFLLPFLERRERQI
mmetsp:Transcript_20803/g.58533  ORF Transcript_20803/g.58533 Transcript_20803/m.58533 type:complete len:306 (+) Transcript_20803:354-1271(+)